MHTVFDIAAYVLEKRGKMTAMKLQKLVYYSQAWSLVWDERALFDEKIEAWVNGPVVRELYKWHQGKFDLEACAAGDQTKLDAAAKETIDVVLGFYGDKSSQWLSEATHREKPWIDARKGLGPLERGEREISLSSMQNFYEALYARDALDAAGQ